MSALDTVRRRATLSARYGRAHGDPRGHASNYHVAIYADALGCLVRQLTQDQQIAAIRAWRTAYLAEWPAAEWPVRMRIVTRSGPGWQETIDVFLPAGDGQRETMVDGGSAQSEPSEVAS